jgi:hypothetical protein
MVRSLPTGNLNPGYIDFRVQPFGDLRVTGRFEEQLDGLAQIGLSLFHGVTLADHVELGTDGNISVAFAFE